MRAPKAHSHTIPHETPKSGRHSNNLRAHFLRHPSIFSREYINARRPWFLSSSYYVLIRSFHPPNRITTHRRQFLLSPALLHLLVALGLLHSFVLRTWNGLIAEYHHMHKTSSISGTRLVGWLMPQDLSIFEGIFQEKRMGNEGH